MAMRQDIRTLDSVWIGRLVSGTNTKKRSQQHSGLPASTCYMLLLGMLHGTVLLLMFICMSL